MTKVFFILCTVCSCNSICFSDCLAHVAYTQLLQLFWKHTQNACKLHAKQNQFPFNKLTSVWIGPTRATLSCLNSLYYYIYSIYMFKFICMRYSVCVFNLYSNKRIYPQTFGWQKVYLLFRGSEAQIKHSLCVCTTNLHKYHGNSIQ